MQGKGEVTGRSFHAGLLKHSVAVSEAATRTLITAFATPQTRRYELPLPRRFGNT